MRRDLRFIVAQVGRRRVTLAVAGCAVVGASLSAAAMAVRLHRHPLSPKEQ